MGLRLLALACLVGAAFAGPLQKQSWNQYQCATQCTPSSHQKFSYEIGKAYTYEYRGENTVSTTGKPRQKATIEGLAVIQVLDKCEMVLQLKNLRIQQKLSPEEIHELTQKLEVPVPFAFEDGKVERVCPSQEEDLQSLNIKKGLISAFINTMSKLDSPQDVREVDSMGSCNTKYSVKYVQGLEVQKEKNLVSCTNRQSSVTALITNPYESHNSKVHSLPIFPEESLMCKQQIEDKIIKKVECQEHGKIQPLRQRESVIQFEGQVRLALLSISNAERLATSPQNRPESIMYTFDERKDVETSEREAEHLLSEMCHKNQPTLDTSVSKDFIQLISLVQGLPYSSLSKIHSSLKRGQPCSSQKIHDLFVDTLPMAGSDSAIKLMVQLILNKDISGLKAKFWPPTLALIPKPSRETVAAVIPLLKEQPSGIVLLGVSAMVHRFCSSHSCDREPVAQQVASTLSQQIGEECSNENESQTLAALKAFGNIGYHGAAERNILACAQNKDKPTRLRLAAIDAFRRVSKKRPEQLLSIYCDPEENSEVRIAAFSCVMKQADAAQLRRIKTTAERESDEQVIGYTSSFLTNMKKASSPTKKGVRNALKSIEINPPKVNYWMNSKNIELSTFSETFNVGGSIETDIVHAQDSKIPRSVTTRFDADILNNNINIFEIGVRAEGLESILKNIVGLKDKIPSSPSWNLLSSEAVFGSSEAEASAFIRTMNTEILDISASDLSGVGEMIQLANLMKQLSQGKSADFSHSFLFMNSKLVIPSVTGRSYSFGVTGSATLGLTASTKLDVLRFPRNSDATAHFQPSVNVEVSTTVGIQSSKHRPDIKLISRMHLESDVEAQFKIKDGHFVIVSLSLPSDNIVRARVSSDVVEISADHHEKPLYPRMQKKIDYCFDKLHKPLGLAVCGILEIPKPFVTKTFPYFNAGVGTIEFSIKKTDPGLKSFELVLERPRHSAPAKKFRASFDTPGSHVNRKFSAELNLRDHGRDRREYSLELTSPFMTTAGKGTYSYRPDLLEGTFELHRSSSKLCSANASVQISSSSVKNVLKPSLEVTIGNNHPMKVGGVISVTNGRKQLVSIDIKTNKPSRRPISLKGSIVKEGRIEFSKKSEWKVSSDLSLDSIFFDSQIRTTVEKQSKQAQTLTASMETDYQRGSQKHTMKLSGTSQQSSSKLSTSAQFQSTQFSSANWALKWEMQRKQSIRNDITLKYGRNPEHTYVTVSQNSHLPESGPGHCNIVVKAPQFNIESELSLKHEVMLGKTPKIHVEADLRNTDDKHIKGLLHFDSPSTSPLKAISRVEVEYPGGKLSYSDEVEETSQNKFEGNTRMQWKDDKQARLSYTYQILSDRSKFHHELDASLQVPSRSSPIKSKCSVQMSKESLTVESSLKSHPDSDYSIQAQLKRWGPSSVRVQSSILNGDLKFKNEKQTKSIDLDVRVKGNKPRRITASSKAQLGQKRSFEMEMSWDADRRPEKHISLSTKCESNGVRYSASSKLQVTNLLKMALTESGELSLLGSHTGSLEATLKNRQPIRLDYSHEASGGRCKCYLKFSKNQRAKCEIKLDGKALSTNHGRDLSAKASITSLDGSFENKELELGLYHKKSDSSLDMKTSIRYQRSPSKTYNAEMSAESQPNGIQVRGQVSTPYRRFSRQSALLSIQKSENSLSTSVNIELPEQKVISCTSRIQKKDHEMSSSLVLVTPFAIVRDVKAHLSVNTHRSKKSLMTYLDVNSARLVNVEANMTKSSSEMSAQCQLKVSPIPNVKFQGLSMALKKSRNSFDISGECLMQSDERVSMSASMMNSRSGLSCSASLSTPYKKIQTVSASYKQSKSSAELQGSARYMNNKEISLNSKISKDGSKLSATGNIASPYALKESKVHISIENQDSKKGLVAFVDANGERKGDIEVSLSRSSNGMEVQCRLKKTHEPELSAKAKLQKRGKSFTFSTKVTKGASPLLANPTTLKANGLRHLLDLEISRENSRHSDLYNMTLSGSMTPVSLNMSTSRNENDVLNIEAEACRESHQRQCYSLKTIRKALSHSEGYHHYQLMSLQLDKRTSSSREQLGSANIIFTAKANDYQSKVVVEYQGKTIGYEVRAHVREHEDDQCSFDGHLFMPKQTTRVSASILHKPSHCSLQLEVTPDSSVPSKKLGFELQKDHDERKDECSGYIRAYHPKINTPILLSGRMQRQGMVPARCELKLQYPSSKGSRSETKTLNFELDSDLKQRSSENKFVSCKLYSGDKSLDCSLQLKQEKTRQQDTYGYEWSYKKQSSPKKGGMSVVLSQKRNGQPQNMEISYYTPNIDLKIEGSLAQSRLLSVSLHSSGGKVKEITVRTTDSCMEMDVKRQGPVFQGSLCVNKQVGNSVQFVSMDAFYRRQKSLDLSVGTEPKNPAFLDIQMKWNSKDLSRAMSEITGFSELLQDRSLQDLEEELMAKLSQWKNEVVVPVYEDLVERLKQLKEEKCEQMKNTVQYHHEMLQDQIQQLEHCKVVVTEWLQSFPGWNYIHDEVLHPLSQAIRCLFDTYFQLSLKHIPDVARIVIQVTKEQFEHCLRTFCVRGTFCYDFRRTYERYGMEEAKKVIYKKMTLKNMKNTMSEANPIPEITRRIKEKLEDTRRDIEASIHKFMESEMYSRLIAYGKRIEERVREHAPIYIERLIHKVKEIFQKAELDEDFRTMRSLTQGLENQVKNVWENKERYAIKEWGPMKDTMMAKGKEMLQDRFQVSTFDPQRGDIKMRVRHPLKQRHIQVVSNILRACKQKLQQSVMLMKN